LSHQLTGNHYRDFLSHYLPKLQEDVPLAVSARMWYMLDGTPVHCSRAVRDVLNIYYSTAIVLLPGGSVDKIRTYITK
jgi:hypothetical protein